VYWKHSNGDGSLRHSGTLGKYGSFDINGTLPCEDSFDYMGTLNRTRFTRILRYARCRGIIPFYGTTLDWDSLAGSGTLMRQGSFRASETLF
jgi:hypothetical protein